MAEDVGSFGLGRREVQKDTNAPTEVKPNQLPLGTVMSPQNASFSGVSSGFDTVAKVLGDIGSTVSQWVDKEQDNERIQGRLWYAQGKTQEEVLAAGSHYAVQGYMGVQAEESAIRWKQAAVQAIADEDMQLPPDAYRAKLTDSFKQMSDKLSTADPYVRKLLVAQAENIFPDLMSKQVVAHNKFNEDKTIQSVSSLIVTKASDPESTKDSLVEILENPHGLKQEAHNKVITEAAIALFRGGEGTVDAATKFSSALGVKEREVTDSRSKELGLPSGVLENILKLESYGGKDFEADGTPLLAKIKSTLPDGTDDTARYRMQVKPSVAKDPGYGIKPAQGESAEEYNRVGEELLAAHYKRLNSLPLAVLAYHSGSGTVNKAMERLGDPRINQVSWNDFVQQFPNKEGSAYVTSFMKNYSSANIEGVRNEVNLLSSLVSKGMSIAQAEKIQNAYNEHVQAKSNKFSTEKALMEQELVNSVLDTGDYRAGLDSLTEAKKKYNLSDSWAERLSNQMQSAQKEYFKNFEEASKITAGISGNSIGDLTSDQQKKAFKIVDAQIQGQGQARGLEGDTLQDYVAERKAELISSNGGVVDTGWGRRISGAAAQDVLSKDGNLNPNVVRAYKDYLALYRKAGPSVANQYAGKSADFFESAVQFDAGSGTKDALISAKVEQDKKLTVPGYTRPTIDKEVLDKGISDAIDDLDPSWFRSKNLVRGSVRQDAEVEAYKSNPEFRSIVSNIATRYRIQNPDDDNAERKAARAAAQRVDFALGNVLVSAPDRTISQDMGLDMVRSNGKVDKALQLALAKLGPEVYKEQWNEFYITSPVQSTKDALRGVPAGNIKYLPSSRTFVYYPKIKERIGTDWMPSVSYGAKPIEISADYAGKLLLDYLKENNLDMYQMDGDILGTEMDIWSTPQNQKLTS